MPDKLDDVDIPHLHFAHARQAKSLQLLALLLALRNEPVKTVQEIVQVCDCLIPRAVLLVRSAALSGLAFPFRPIY